MKSAVQAKGAIPPILITLALVWIGLAPLAQAVSPPPDGCYPNYSTAEGCNALHLLGNGAGNTGVGWYSLFLVGDANYNTGVGAGTLVLNTGDSNTAVGAAALLLNTTGGNNTAVGQNALRVVSGNSNTAVGLGAGVLIVAGGSNTRRATDLIYYDERFGEFQLRNFHKSISPPDLRRANGMS